ncbi:2,3-diaminopropionate biosynthesis protein SbnB [Lysinibacillus macroides]|uniref:Ornithine cyclodeaminase n=1 Tax=Lysinibacillus macroides TaxID=33935 RepID=A0A0M9DH60_9BACI|nr:2,3-diaminopropionate biosynthesis protein SbnB [Lysinibacillus macroides]KOY81378.1 hypothetical protein ADM90_19850 [Lysinibacillus macroides]QPR68449.1 2,3-diaminopropionate biosynthesis protein SbnB [Lysinibacillus macroides]
MNRVDFLYLSQEDIIKAGGLDFNIFIDTLEKILGTHAKGDFVQPLKPYLKRKEQTHVADRIIAMPSYVGGDFDISGIKWISSASQNPVKYNLPRASGVIILNDSEKGIPVAVMDATLINLMRTAAVSGVATKYLARENSRKIGIIGAGIIGKMQVKAVHNVIPEINEIKVYDLNKERAIHWSNTLEKEIGVKIIIAKSAQDALQNADIIITSTTAEEGYIEGDWIKKGSLFLNVSLNDPKFDVILKADKIIVDDWEQCNRKDKVLNKMYKQKLISEQDIHAELGEIVLKQKTGRISEDEIIFFNPMGMSVEDIGSAYTIYKRAKDLGIGTTLSLWEKPIGV